MRVQRTILLAASVLFCAIAASGQEFEGRLRGARAEVEASYAELQTLSAGDVREQFAKLTPQMQGDVWTTHLLRVLDDHPELSHEQRGVFYEALGLIASGMFEADKRSPAWQTQFREQLTYLDGRARQLLPPELHHRALYSLNREAARVLFQPGRRDVTVNYICHCNTINGALDCGGDKTCYRIGQECTRTTAGCGQFFQDPCNGLCYY
jgi:hypothetical protein